jgi:predicted O-methyltransferase YrrM
LPTPRESNRNARKFPNVIGARDGCHVKVNRPQHHQDSYINGKGFHSVLIQGIVETRKLFLDVRVYCGELGSPHDARFLRKSAIYRKPENILEIHILLGISPILLYHGLYLHLRIMVN